MKGVFITFEGIEGAGKSTQAKKLKEYLEYIGKKVILTREPGGTKIGLKIREIVLSHWDEIFPNIAELLLYEADRNIHIYNVIKPKLKEGYIVISDRFTDSTVAYQHFARGIDRNIVDYLNNLATDGLKPDITFLIDIPVSESLKRLKDKDRIEQEDITFHQKLREGFLKIAEEEKDRFIILDGTENEDIIFDKIINILSAKKII